MYLGREIATKEYRSTIADQVSSPASRKQFVTNRLVRAYSTKNISKLYEELLREPYVNHLNQLWKFLTFRGHCWSQFRKVYLSDLSSEKRNSRQQPVQRRNQHTVPTKLIDILACSSDSRSHETAHDIARHIAQCRTWRICIVKGCGRRNKRGKWRMSATWVSVPFRSDPTVEFDACTIHCISVTL